MNQNIQALSLIYSKLEKLEKVKAEEALACVKSVLDIAHTLDFTPKTFQLLLSVLINYNLQWNNPKTAALQGRIIQAFKYNRDFYSKTDFACILGLMMDVGINKNTVQQDFSLFHGSGSSINHEDSTAKDSTQNNIFRWLNWLNSDKPNVFIQKLAPKNDNIIDDLRKAFDRKNAICQNQIKITLLLDIYTLYLELTQ